MPPRNATSMRRTPGGAERRAPPGAQPRPPSHPVTGRPAPAPTAPTAPSRVPTPPAGLFTAGSFAKGSWRKKPAPTFEEKMERSLAVVAEDAEWAFASSPSSTGTSEHAVLPAAELLSELPDWVREHVQQEANGRMHHLLAPRLMLQAVRHRRRQRENQRAAKDNYGPGGRGRAQARDALSKCPHFRAWPEHALEAMLEHGIVVCAAHGQVIIHQGEPSGVWVLVQGHVRATVRQRRGDQAVKQAGKAAKPGIRAVAATGVARGKPKEVARYSGPAVISSRSMLRSESEPHSVIAATEVDVIGIGRSVVADALDRLSPEQIAVIKEDWRIQLGEGSGVVGSLNLALRRCQLFQGLSEAQLQLIAHGAHPVKIAEGQELCTEGHEAHQILFARRGLIGWESFGAVACAYSDVHSATVIAQGFAPEGWALGRKELRGLLREPSVRACVLEAAERLRTSEMTQDRAVPSIAQWMGDRVAAAPVFREISMGPSLRAALVAALVPRACAARDNLVLSNGVCDRVLLIHRGVAAADDDSGVMRPGDVTGYSCLAEHRWLRTLTASEACCWWDLPRESLLTVLRKYQALNSYLHHMDALLIPGKGHRRASLSHSRTGRDADLAPGASTVPRQHPLPTDGQYSLKFISDRCGLLPRRATAAGVPSLALASRGAGGGMDDEEESPGAGRGRGGRRRSSATASLGLVDPRDWHARRPAGRGQHGPRGGAGIPTAEQSSGTAPQGPKPPRQAPGSIGTEEGPPTWPEQPQSPTREGTFTVNTEMPDRGLFLSSSPGPACQSPLGSPMFGTFSGSGTPAAEISPGWAVSSRRLSSAPPRHSYAPAAVRRRKHSRRPESLAQVPEHDGTSEDRTLASSQCTQGQTTFLQVVSPLQDWTKSNTMSTQLDTVIEVPSLAGRSAVTDRERYRFNDSAPAVQRGLAWALGYGSRPIRGWSRRLTEPTVLQIQNQGDASVGTAGLWDKLEKAGSDAESGASPLNSSPAREAALAFINQEDVGGDSAADAGDGDSVHRASTAGASPAESAAQSRRRSPTSVRGRSYEALPSPPPDSTTPWGGDGSSHQTQQQARSPREGRWVWRPCPVQLPRGSPADFRRALWLGQAEQLGGEHQLLRLQQQRPASALSRSRPRCSAGPPVDHHYCLQGRRPRATAAAAGGGDGYRVANRRGLKEALALGAWLAAQERASPHRAGAAASSSTPTASASPQTGKEPYPPWAGCKIKPPLLTWHKLRKLLRGRYDPHPVCGWRWQWHMRPCLRRKRGQPRSPQAAAATGCSPAPTPVPPPEPPPSKPPPRCILEVFTDAAETPTAGAGAARTPTGLCPLQGAQMFCSESLDSGDFFRSGGQQSDDAKPRSRTRQRPANRQGSAGRSGRARAKRPPSGVRGLRAPSSPTVKRTDTSHSGAPSSPSRWHSGATSHTPRSPMHNNFQRGGGARSESAMSDHLHHHHPPKHHGEAPTRMSYVPGIGSVCLASDAPPPRDGAA
eukprot:TRINITY_DN8103_c0_g1_i1.p1 TRINITY_DN8103_c0_g1~~TRINITY_DN8103_c0_g1_i1.p1  ORF type:complete len:1487 (+),score=130.34 TRINITY_DN8103_c0_g1_i1:83-4543(+)